MFFRTEPLRGKERISSTSSIALISSISRPPPLPPAFGQLGNIRLKMEDTNHGKGRSLSLLTPSTYLNLGRTGISGAF